MSKTDKNAFTKPLCLTAAGVALQLLGSACLVVAALGAMKEINSQLKQALIEKLSQ